MSEDEAVRQTQLLPQNTHLVFVELAQRLYHSALQGGRGEKGEGRGEGLQRGEREEGRVCSSGGRKVHLLPQFSDKLCVVVVGLDDVGPGTSLGRRTLNQVWTQRTCRGRGNAHCSPNRYMYVVTIATHPERDRLTQPPTVGLPSPHQQPAAEGRAGGLMQLCMSW